MIRIQTFLTRFFLNQIIQASVFSFFILLYSFNFIAPLSMLTITSFVSNFLFILEETYQRSPLTLLSYEKGTSKFIKCSSGFRPLDIIHSPGKSNYKCERSSFYFLTTFQLGPVLNKQRLEAHGSVIVFPNHSAPGL